jgi:hypothetical protein
MIPKHYAVTHTPLEEFYLNKGLKVRTRSGWKNLPHYHPGMNKYARKGWSWYCLHPRGWDAEKDTILTFLKILELALQFPFKSLR